MKKIMMILLPTLLISGCGLASVSSNNEELYEHTLDAYYDYELNNELSNGENTNPLLLFKIGNNDKNRINLDLSKHDISNVIGGDKITFFSNEKDILVQDTLPGTICIPNDAKDFSIDETSVYKFEIKDNKESLHCLDNNTSYSFNNKVIKEDYYLSLVNTNDLYDSMILYGTFNSDNQIDALFTYNPRLNNEYKQKYIEVKEETYTFIEKEDNIGSFICNDYLIKTDISEYDDLVIGNEYKLYTNSTSLVQYYLGVQYLIKPYDITLVNDFKNNTTIDIKVFCNLESYDGMPRGDENGKMTLPHDFMRFDYQSCYYHIDTSISFNELCETTTLEDSLYFDNKNINIYSSYEGFDIIDNSNKNQYLLDKDTKISEDTIIFIDRTSMVTYM